MSHRLSTSPQLLFPHPPLLHTNRARQASLPPTAAPLLLTKHPRRCHSSRSATSCCGRSVLRRRSRIGVGGPLWPGTPPEHLTRASWALLHCACEPPPPAGHPLLLNWGWRWNFYKDTPSLPPIYFTVVCVSQENCVKPLIRTCVTRLYLISKFLQC
jgi:hypothetical protein